MRGNRARQPNDPSRVAAQREVEKLENEYHAMWERKYAQTTQTGCWA